MLGKLFKGNKISNLPSAVVKVDASEEVFIVVNSVVNVCDGEGEAEKVEV